MSTVPDFLTDYAITNEFIDEWLDWFDPSIKTFVTNFVFNVLRKYDFDHEKIECPDDREFAVILSGHFFAFLKLKYQEQNPNRILLGYALTS